MDRSKGALLLLMLFLGCTENKPVAKLGDTVTVDYIGMFSNGTVFDTSILQVAQRIGLSLEREYAPLIFTLGGRQVILGFEEGIIGMKEGETKTVTISPADAYGSWKSELVLYAPIEKFMESNMTPEAGREIYTNYKNVTYRGKVVATNSTTVIIDLNHPMAGETLSFQITLLKIGN
jgi:peptidylprolyl isomerase